LKMIPVPIPIPAVDTEKEPDHVAHGALQGINKWGQSNYEGVKEFVNQPIQG